MDKNADITFVPTDVIRDDYIMKGFDPRRVLTSGFPVRDDIVVLNKPKTVDQHVNILMVNTSTDLKKNIKFVKEVSRLDNVSIKFICGLDKRLSDKMNIPFHVADDPLRAVARGTCNALKNISNYPFLMR